MPSTMVTATCISHRHHNAARNSPASSYACHRAGDCVISLGTSGTLFGCFHRPLIDPSGTVAPFCDATGQFLPLVCTMNCTNTTNEVREAFALDRDDIEALASDEAPGCSGVNFLPFLTGERTPNWPLATAAILGLRPGSLRSGVLYRAAMEGAAFALLGGGFAAPTLVLSKTISQQHLGFALGSLQAWRECRSWGSRLRILGLSAEAPGAGEA